MRITEVAAERHAGVIRVRARLIWENLDRPPFDLFVDTEDRFADAVRSDPNAILMACALPAWRFGEQRIAIDGSVCPLLCRNLTAVFARVDRWNPREYGPPPRIEPRDGFATRTPSTGPSLSLLSCGIDSLATLRWNTLSIPRGHPRAIGAVVHVAFDDDPAPSARRLAEVCDPRRLAVERVAADAGVEAIPLRTNVRWLVGDGHFFDRQWHGAAFLSSAAVLSGGFQRAYLAAGQDPWVDEPWGSHPLLDPFLTSAHFATDHDLLVPRFDKVRIVADWSAGRTNLRVCQNDIEGGGNCGTCEKCIRTTLMLLVLGGLEGAPLIQDVTPWLVGLLGEFEMISPLEGFVEYYERLVPGLSACGREDLAEALLSVLAAARAEVPA